MLTALLGVNWKTTLAGLSVIVAGLGRIVLAWKSRDFESVLTDGQLLLSTLIAVLAGLGLVKAKDQNIIGAGATAKTVDSDGQVINREGIVVGQQPKV